MPGGLDNKKLLFIGAGIEMIPGIEMAKSLGLTVIATDRNPEAPGFSHAHFSEIASTRDPRANIDIAKQYQSTMGLDGVMTLGSDIPLTIAKVADACGLPGVSVETASIMQNKLKMKEAMLRSNIPMPLFRKALSLDEAVKAADDIGYPVVVKPVDNSAARGVSLVPEKSDIESAFRVAKSFSMGEDIVLIEQFLDGPQISTESFVYRGKIVTTGFADRNYELNQRFLPYFVEDGHTIPSQLSDYQVEEVTSAVENAIRKLGIDFGVGKGDIVLTPEGPKIIEIAARLSGGHFSSITVPLATGVNIVKEVITISVGEDPSWQDLEPKMDKGVAQRYFFPPAGKIERIENLDAVKQLEWVNFVELEFEIGHIVSSFTNHADRAGCVIATGENREEAVKRAEEARDMVKFIMS